MRGYLEIGIFASPYFSIFVKKQQKDAKIGTKGLVSRIRRI